MFRIEIANKVKGHGLAARVIRRAIATILKNHHYETATISVAIVDDRTIAELHGQYLGDPSPTDVMSFRLEEGPQHLEGEIVVSAETAEKRAATLGVPLRDELLLYVVHGTLHLVGYNDTMPDMRRKMRRAERAVFEALGLRYPSGQGSAQLRRAKSSS